MQARLYPINHQAAKTGIIRVTFIDTLMGQGELSAILPDGEVLQGEYTTVDSSSRSYGNIYTHISSTLGSAYGYGSTSSTTIQGSSPGNATLYGNNGTRVDCDYIANNFSRNGFGVCKTSDGALYKLHF